MMKPLEYDVLENLIERKDGESSAAYNAFLHYARLSPLDRGADSVDEKIAKTLGKSLSTVRQYKYTYEWENRVQLIDAYQFKLDFDETRNMMKADREKYVEFNREIKSTMMENLKKTTNVIANLLSYADLIGEEKKTGQVELKDGTTAFLYTKVDMKAKLSDIAVLANSVTKCARAINDLPTEVIENKVASNINLNNLDSQQLDELDEQVAARIRQIEAKAILTSEKIN